MLKGPDLQYEVGVLDEHNCRKTSVSQRNIMTRQDISQTCHMRHIITPDDQTIKK